MSKAKTKPKPQAKPKRPKRGEAATSPRRLLAADKSVRAIQMRIAGMTYIDIAEALGYENPGTAYKAVLRGLKQAVQEPGEELIKIELDRLDSLWRTAYPLAKQGVLGAIDRCLRIQERRARLLGLDKPIRVEGSWDDSVRKQGGDPEAIFETLVAGVLSGGDIPPESD